VAAGTAVAAGPVADADCVVCDCIACINCASASCDAVGTSGAMFSIICDLFKILPFAEYINLDIYI
jgi:hypothetical protein